MTDMYDAILLRAKEQYAQNNALEPIKAAKYLMDTPGVAMHCPEHHFIVPAALLAAAHKQQNSNIEELEADLLKAKARAQTVPGGFCGNCGCCGAAVGTGIFLSIWLNTNPKSDQNWSKVNRMTANSLTEIAAIEGPRCCKRVTFLALRAASDFCEKELGLKLCADKEIVCGYFASNKECKGVQCPFFPKRD